MSKFKDLVIILTGILMILVVLGTAILPIILSIALGNWLWMFLYAVTWTAIVTEVVVFGLIWAGLAELLS